MKTRQWAPRRVLIAKFIGASSLMAATSCQSTDRPPDAPSLHRQTSVHDAGALGLGYKSALPPRLTRGSLAHGAATVPRMFAHSLTHELVVPQANGMVAPFEHSHSPEADERVPLQVGLVSGSDVAKHP